MQDQASANGSDATTAAGMRHDSQLLRLAAWLAVGADADTKLLLAAIFRPQPAMSPSGVRELLQELTERSIRNSAAAIGAALGLAAPQLAEMFHPDAQAFELAGRRGALLRLDRVWGGPAMVLMRALLKVELLSPGPGEMQFMCTRGVAWLGPKQLPNDQPLALRKDQVLVLHPGAAVLFRGGLLLGTLIEAAAAAGIPLPELDAISTAAGPLKLDGSFALLHGEKRKLTPAEIRVLRRLMRQPGEIVARDQLGANVERVVVSLRNKLGDGIIQTVYGSGYLLDSR